MKMKDKARIACHEYRGGSNFHFREKRKLIFVFYEGPGILFLHKQFYLVKYAQNTKLSVYDTLQGPFSFVNA